MNANELVFVYAKGGRVLCLNRQEAVQAHDPLCLDGWKHTATINPSLWVQAVCNSIDHTGPQINELRNGLTK